MEPIKNPEYPGIVEYYELTVKKFMSILKIMPKGQQ